MSEMEDGSYITVRIMSQLIDTNNYVSVSFFQDPEFTSSVSTSQYTGTIFLINELQMLLANIA